MKYLVLIVFLFAFYSRSIAYDCNNTQFADFIFAGTVESYESERNSDTGEIKSSSAKFINLNWKTFSLRKTITVYGSSSPQCGCHYDFKVGSTYNVVGEYIGGKAFTYYCIGIKEIVIQ